jgi:hypothetical protein
MTNEKDVPPHLKREWEKLKEACKAFIGNDEKYAVKPEFTFIGDRVIVNFPK